MRQLDLFHDNPKTVARNELREALSARDSRRSRIALERLSVLDPLHGLATDVRTLIAVMEAPTPEGQEQGFERIHSLEQKWLPAAEALLGADGSRDFLAPVWRCIGQAIESAPFDPPFPKRHASWAYRQGRDWTNVQCSVLTVQGYETIPVLLARLAEAEWQLGNRTQAIDHWITLCWRSAPAFEQLVGEPDFPDEGVAAAWHRARDADLEPELSSAWFPAWMLLEDPVLARQCAAREGQDRPSRAFQVVRKLLTTGPEDPSNLSLRRALRALHPGLLASFLKKFARP